MQLTFGRPAGETARMDEEANARLMRDGWFAALPAARRAAILAGLQVRDVAHGTRLYRIGDRPNGLHVVIDGRVQLVSYPAAGTEMVNMIVKAGRWFGELSLIDGKPRPHDAVVVGDARVGWLPMIEAARLASDSASWWRELALLTCAHQRLAMREASRTRSQPAILRLAALLASSAGTGGGTVRMTQDEIARTVGISRQHANRLLGQLAGRGLVRRAYGAIEAGDAAGLRRMADQAP